MSPRHRLEPQKIGSLIGASFGLVFVLVNSSSLAGIAAGVVRTLGVLAFVAVVAAVLRLPAWTPPGVPDRAFTRPYWVVVAVEAIALFAGVRILAGPLGMPEAGVAWVATVVGVHFLVLARVWRLRFFDVLGGSLLGCGVVGLALAVAGAERVWIDVIAGVLSGAILLAFGLWGALQGRRHRSSP